MRQEHNAYSDHLLRLAQRIAGPYIALPQARAAMVVGSTAEGQSDGYSDLDMSIFYETLPSEEQLAAARQHNGSGERLWLLGARQDGGIIEAYNVGGVECQLVHTTIAAWEQQLAVVLEELNVTSPLHKALDGTLHGLAIFGEPLINGWKERVANYPAALARAMVEHYLAFFPIWYLQERFVSRDAVLWRQQILLEAAQHILGVLAGLNRLYYSTFQFKRMRRFIARMGIAPRDLAERIESLFALESAAAIGQLEELVAEVVLLVEQHMPQVETARVRKRIGQRQTAWQLSGLAQGE